MSNKTGWTRIADNNDISEILQRLGTTADTGGTTTSGSIMAKLNAVISADNNISGYTITNNVPNKTGILSQKLAYIIDALLGETGSTGGTESSGTAMAKLNAIIEYEKIIKALTDTNNTASKTGILSQKLAYVIDALLGETGSTGGTESSGTAMAKLNALITYLYTNLSPSRVRRMDDIGKTSDYAGKSMVKVPKTTLATVGDVFAYSNAKGGLLRMIINAEDNGDTREYLSLSVDGNYIFTNTSPKDMGATLTYSSGQSHQYYELMVPFSSNVSVVCTSVHQYISSTDIVNIYGYAYINK